MSATAKKPMTFGNYFDFIGIVLIHIGTGLAFYRGGSWKLVLLALAMYVLRMFAITGVYHRYFSHRTYKTSRVFQFILAFIGTMATQKGPLWWASNHRHHHKFSDTEHDIHSPSRKGFWHSHMGWWMGREHEEVQWNLIRDYAKYPELRWLDKYHVTGVFTSMAIVSVIAGWDGFLWGYVVSTFFLMHATFTINSLSHVFGTRRFKTTDTSRNNWFLAIITMGEGWHNNHHHFQSSCPQGFYWYEYDFTYYIIKAMSWVGLVWDIRMPPQRILDEGRNVKDAPLPAPDPIGSAAE